MTHAQCSARDFRRTLKQEGHREGEKTRRGILGQILEGSYKVEGEIIRNSFDISTGVK